MKSILDPTFKYINSSNTDLRKTFARVRRQQREQQQREKEQKVVPLAKSKRD